MSTETVILEVTDRVATLRLARPQDANRIDTTTMRGFIRELEAAAAADVDVLVITGDGPDFSVGRDQHEELPDGMTKLSAIELVVHANRALARFEGIVVTQVRGRALGFGCGLVVQSDIAVAADTAHLGFDEIRHGTAPAFVMSYLEHHVGPKRALDLVLTGRVLGAPEALDFGIVSRVVPADLLAPTVEAIVARLLDSPGELLRRCKAYLRENRSVAPEERLDHAFASFQRRATPAP